MRKLFIIAAIALLSGCGGNGRTETDLVQEKPNKLKFGQFDGVSIFHGCYYLEQYGGLTHLGNCPNHNADGSPIQKYQP